MSRSLLIAAAVVLPAAAQAQPLVEFSRIQARGVGGPIVFIEASNPEAAKPAVYQARMAESRGREVKIDSTTCPALQAVVESIADAPLSNRDSEGLEIIVADGIGYSLTVYPADASPITVTGNTGPATEWIAHALEQLKDCWPLR